LLWQAFDRLERRCRPRAGDEYVRVLALAQLFERLEDGVVVLIIVLLVLWLVATVIGFAFKGLLWLAIIGIVLFVGTAVIGFVRRNALRR
jgi:hypothetical protein